MKGWLVLAAGLALVGWLFSLLSFEWQVKVTCVLLFITAVLQILSFIAQRSDRSAPHSGDTTDSEAS